MTCRGAPVDDDYTLMTTRIRDVVGQIGINQAEIARRLTLSPGYISEITHGHKRPGVDFLVGMRRELGVSVDWLISGKGEMFCPAEDQRARLNKAIERHVDNARTALDQLDRLVRTGSSVWRETERSGGARRKGATPRP